MNTKGTLKRLGISLTKETDKGTCVKTSYELLEELSEKWETQLLKDWWNNIRYKLYNMHKTRTEIYWFLVVF